MTAYAHLLLADGERQSGGNPQLLFNQVNAGDHFRHRMLHLNAGIHFDKIKLTLLIEKFKGAGTAIADVQTGFGTALADSLADFRGDPRRRGLLHHLLVAALDGTVTLA